LGGGKDATLVVEKRSFETTGGNESVAFMEKGDKFDPVDVNTWDCVAPLCEGHKVREFLV